MYNAKQLATRDPAMAALMGIVAGSDFGFESDDAFETSGFAPEPRFADSGYASGYGSESEVGWEAVGAEGFFGADGGFFGADEMVEGDFGSDFGAGPVPKPTESQALRLWHHHARRMSKQTRRKSLLYPNAGIDDKIQRYQLNVSQNFTIGTAATIANLTKQPDTSLRPQRILANVPVPVLVFYSEIKVANVSVTQGDSGDAFFLNANSWGTQFDIPTLSPSNRVTVLANCTTFVPPGFLPGNVFPLVFSFIGPASEVA